MDKPQCRICGNWATWMLTGSPRCDAHQHTPHLRRKPRNRSMLIKMAKAAVR